MSNVSNMAVVDPSAKIGSDVTIGPFCVIGPDVIVGDGCELKNSITVEGVTRIGKNNVIYPYAVIGIASQDLKYKGELTLTNIGDGNVIRENTMIHRGTEMGGGETVVGNYNFIMGGAHIAHDCVLADNILLGNQVMLAGHVKIETGAVISAILGVNHFVSIGKYSYVGAMSPVRRDVPPFMKVSGDPAEIRGVNVEGLKRNGFSEQDMADIKFAYKQLFRAQKRGRCIEDALEELSHENDLNQNVRYLCEFVHKSCQSPNHRALEVLRTDTEADRVRRKPFEVRTK